MALQVRLAPRDLDFIGYPWPTSRAERRRLEEVLSERYGQPEARRRRIFGRRSELTEMGRRAGFRGPAVFVATTCGVDRKTVGDLARGVTKPHAATLTKIAAGLGMSEAEVRRIFELDGVVIRIG